MIPALNYAANRVDAGVKNMGIMISSISLGGLARRVIGGGWPLGFLQGAATGAISYGLIRPIRSQLDKHTGTGENQIHSNTRWQLWVLGKIAQYGVPAVVTVYAGDRILTTLSSITPAPVSSWIAPDPAQAKYNTIMLALIANVAPAAIEHVVSWMRSAEKSHR